MGCQTGFCVLIAGEHSCEESLDLLHATLVDVTHTTEVLLNPAPAAEARPSAGVRRARTLGLP